MLKASTWATIALATIAATASTTHAQIGLGPVNSNSCADGSCTSYQSIPQDRSALFGGSVAPGSSGLFQSHGLPTSCDSGACDSCPSAYSMNGVDLYAYDRQEPWLHGQFQRMPAYSGYNSFRPYNYRHVLAQKQIAAARGDDRAFPFSQQFWNRHRDKYLNRHLADASPADTRQPEQDAATPFPPKQAPTAPGGYDQVSPPHPITNSGRPPVPTTMPMQIMPAPMASIGHPQQAFARGNMMPQQLSYVHQPNTPQRATGHPNMTTRQPAPQPQYASGLFIPSGATQTGSSPVMVIPSPQGSAMHQTSLMQAWPTEVARPLMRPETNGNYSYDERPMPGYGQMPPQSGVIAPR